MAITIINPYQPKANFYSGTFHNHVGTERFTPYEAGPGDAGAWLLGEVLEMHKAMGVQYVNVSAHGMHIPVGCDVGTATVGNSTRGSEPGDMQIALQNVDLITMVADQLSYDMHNATDSEDGWHFCYLGSPMPNSNNGWTPSANWGKDIPGGVVVGQKNGHIDNTWIEGTDFVGTTTLTSNFNGVLRDRYKITLTFLDPDNVPDTGTYFFVRYIVDQSQRDLSDMIWTYATEEVNDQYVIGGPNWTHTVCVGNQTDWVGLDDNTHYALGSYIDHLHSIGCLVEAAHAWIPEVPATPAEVASVGYDLFEVTNGEAPDTRTPTSDAQVFYDAVLSILIPACKKPPAPVGAEDSNFNINSVGTRGVEIFADSLTVEEMQSSLAAGNCVGWFGGHGSSNLHLSPITVSGDQITIGTNYGSSSPLSCTYNWITINGVMQTTSNVTQDTYTATVGDVYVRLYVQQWSGGSVIREAWTTPFIIMPLIEASFDHGSTVDGLFNTRLAG